MGFVTTDADVRRLVIIRVLSDYQKGVLAESLRLSIVIYYLSSGRLAEDERSKLHKETIRLGRAGQEQGGSLTGFDVGKLLFGKVPKDDLPLLLRVESAVQALSRSREVTMETLLAAFELLVKTSSL